MFSVTPETAVAGQRNVQEGSRQDIKMHVSLLHLHYDGARKIRNTYSSDKDENGRKGIFNSFYITFLYLISSPFGTIISGCRKPFKGPYSSLAR